MLKKNSIFGELVSMAKKKNSYTFLLNEENPYDVKNYVDTGCYALNAVLSDGDIFKGLPDGKRIMIAGKASTAKSLFTSFIISSYIKSKKNGYVIFFETEGSTVTRMAKTAGIPEDRMIVIPVSTIEECRTQMVNLIDKIIDKREGYETKLNAKGEKVRKKIKDYKYKSDEEFIFCIDSLGMLSTLKETSDVSSGADKRDMTRAQLLKGFARVISLKLSIAQTPLIIVNHVYSGMDQYSPDVVSGGSGGQYMSDIILALYKSKEKEGERQVGVNIRVKVVKSRFMIEEKELKILLHFKRGLYKLSNMVEFGQEFGVLKKDGYSYLFPDGKKYKMKDVKSKPSKYIKDDTLKLIGKAIEENFSFGNFIEDSNSDFEDVIDVTDSSEIEEVFGDE